MTTTTATPAAATPAEPDALRYARQTRNAVVFLAWVVGLMLVASVILGIVMAKAISSENNLLNCNNGGGLSNCSSLGGTNPNC